MLGLSAPGELPLSTLRASDLFAATTNFVYASDRGYNSLPTDVLANQSFPARLTQPITYTRSIGDGNRFGGSIARSNGEVVFANMDGLYDTVAVNHAVDGREVIIKRLRINGASDVSYNASETIARLYGSYFEANCYQAVLTVRDKLYLLDLPFQDSFFAGSGGAEGGDDLKNVPKPEAFGYCWNEEPVYLGVISGKHSYYVSDNIDSVPAARDRGVALTLVASAPTSGQYSFNSSTGVLTIGGSLPEQLTVDIQGKINGSPFMDKTGEIILYILQNYTTLAAEEIDIGSFDTVDVQQPAPVGLYVKGEQTVVSVVNQLLAGIGAFLRVTREGRVAIGIFRAPDGKPRITIDDGVLLRRGDRFDVERITPPAGVTPAVWRVHVGWKPNGTVQTDLASTATEDDKEFAEQAFRISSVKTDAVQTRHKYAQELNVDGRFLYEADAETEATRLLALYAPGRSVFRIGVKAVYSPILDINEVVRFTFPRWGFDQGILGRIVGVSLDASTNTMQLTVFF